MMSYIHCLQQKNATFWLKTLSNENNFSKHIRDSWSDVPVNQWKSFNLKLQLTSKLPSKPVDAGALPVGSFNWGRNSPWSFSKTSNLYATNKSSDGNLLIWNELPRLHDTIYRLRFYSNSLTLILSLSNSHNNGSNFTIPRTEEVPACISWYVIWVKHSNLDVTMMQVSCNLLPTSW